MFSEGKQRNGSKGPSRWGWMGTGRRGGRGNCRQDVLYEESEKNVNGLLVIIRTLGLYEFIFLLELVLLLKNTK